jgi:hypothetical protein
MVNTSARGEINVVRVALQSPHSCTSVRRARLQRGSIEELPNVLCPWTDLRRHSNARGNRRQGVHDLSPPTAFAGSAELRNNAETPLSPLNAKRIRCWVGAP